MVNHLLLLESLEGYDVANRLMGQVVTRSSRRRQPWSERGVRRRPDAPCTSIRHQDRAVIAKERDHFYLKHQDLIQARHRGIPDGQVIRGT